MVVFLYCRNPASGLQYHSKRIKMSGVLVGVLYEG